MLGIRHVTPMLEFVIAVLVLIGIILANGGRDDDIARLDKNQEALFKVIEEKTAEIERLKDSQKQIQEHIVKLYASSGGVVSVDASGHLITETADYALGLPKRAAKEVERFVDKINPF